MKIFNIFFTLVAIVTIAACADVMDDKEAIDAQHSGDPSKLPTGLNVSTTKVSYDYALVSATWTNNGDEPYEAGFIYSKSETFDTYSIISSDKFQDTSVADSFPKLDAETKYYVKLYVQTRSNGIAYSEPSSFTTIAAPTFEDTYLFGDYLAVDIDIDSGEGEPEYEVNIKQDGTTYNRVQISNIWDGGRTIIGVVDFAKKTITVDNTNIIYVHSSYGNCFMYGLVVEGGAIVGYAKQTIATYDDKGNIEFAPWAAHVSAGDFGWYITVLEKK